MLLTGKARKLVSNYAYLETIVIVALYLGAGYWHDPQDICLLSRSIPMPFLTILLAIITLFHGISSGLLAITLIGIAMKFSYPEFDYQPFLGELVLVLIFGEFHYYWKRAISQHETGAIFTRQKLQELSKAFYMLKISHDQIERSYIVKPMSIRNSIRLIKEEYQRDDRDAFYRFYLRMLKRTFAIEQVKLLKIKGKKMYETLASSKEFGVFDSDDLMVVDALQKQKSIYVSSGEHYENSSYLAVIPAVINDKVVGLLVIKKMPFMSFNKDTLVSISILTNYLFNEAHKLFVLQKIKDFLPEFQENLRFETHRLKLLYQNYGVESTLLVFRSDNRLAIHQLKGMIKRNLRVLDTMSRATIGTTGTIVILFPFADFSSIEGFLKRVDHTIDLSGESHSVSTGRFLISQLDLALQYIYQEER